MMKPFFLIRSLFFIKSTNIPPLVAPPRPAPGMIQILQQGILYGYMIKGSLGGETSVLRTFRMSGKELVKERVSKERVRQGKS